MRSILVTIVLTLVVAVGGTLAWLLSGRFDVAASTPDHPLLAWLLEETREASITRRAAGIEVPPLDDPQLLAVGAEHYDAMCAICHTPPGGRQSELARGLNPAAPDLAEEADELTPAELYWVIRNGIRMTGMPAWGPTHDEQALWGLTAFVRRLPSMDAADYRAAVAAAGAGGGHHHDHAGHGHGSDLPGAQPHDGHAHPASETRDAAPAGDAGAAPAHDHAQHGH